MMSTRSRRGFLQATLGGALLCTPPRLFARSRGQDSVPWLKETQTPPQVLPEAAPELPPLLASDATLSDWKRQRALLRRKWLEVLRPLDVPRVTPPRLRVVEQDRVGDVIRERVAYEVEPGLATEGYLLRPQNRSKCPGVVVFHSTVAHSIRQPAGVEGRPEKAFGLKLAQRGCVTFCPRNFLWPTNDGIEAREQTRLFQRRHPGCTGMAKMLYDAQVALDILAARDEVDASRLGCVGHSLGAKEVVYLAAFDERIRVTVSSEGGIGTRFSNWHDPWYLGEAMQEPNFDREHHELLGLIAPRPFLLLGGDSADGDQSWPFISAALPVYRRYSGVPRIGLFNHRQGHSVPPAAEARIYEWFSAWL